MNRLPYGVSPATSIFQRIIENLLGGIPHVAVFIDDIIISGESEEEHINNIESVLKKLNSSGFKVKLEKCERYQDEVTYLGHRLCADGLKKTQEKIQAIKELRSPSNKTEVRSLMGLVNYYARYIPNLACAK